MALTVGVELCFESYHIMGILLSRKKPLITKIYGICFTNLLYNKKLCLNKARVSPKAVSKCNCVWSSNRALQRMSYPLGPLVTSMSNKTSAPSHVDLLHDDLIESHSLALSTNSCLKTVRNSLGSRLWTKVDRICVSTSLFTLVMSSSHIETLVRFDGVISSLL